MILRKRIAQFVLFVNGFRYKQDMYRYTHILRPGSSLFSVLGKTCQISPPIFNTLI